MKQALRLLGLAAFLGSLALLGWWWVRPASRGGPGAGLPAALVDAALFSGFALHHSLLAREAFQRRLSRFVPADMMRTTYVLVASLLLTLTCLLWRPIGGTVYVVTGPVAVLLEAAQISGVALTLLAVRRISLRELAGLDIPPHAPEAPVRHDGPYRLVRHPMYLGWVLIVGATPLMTADRLLFATLSIGYLAVAIPFEEAGLRRKFGEPYRAYQRAVRWRLVPFLY